jgi:hypothetical protein
MRKVQTVTGILVAALAGANVMAPVVASAGDKSTDSRFEKLEERVRDAEARLAKVEAMVNQHGAHAAGQQPMGNQGMQQGNKGGMGGGMMDDNMMGMPDPTAAPQAQQNPSGNAPMGGGGMGDM